MLEGGDGEDVGGEDVGGVDIDVVVGGEEAVVVGGTVVADVVTAVTEEVAEAFSVWRLASSSCANVAIFASRDGLSTTSWAGTSGCCS